MNVLDQFFLGGLSSLCVEMLGSISLKQMEAHWSDMVYTHVQLDSCHGDYRSKGHTQGYHKPTQQHYTDLRFCLLLWDDSDAFFLYTLFLLLCTVSDLKLRGNGFISDVFSLCITV